MILVIDCGSRWSVNIGEVLEGLQVNFEVLNFEDFDSNQIGKYDRIIISGAPILLTEVDNRPYLEKFKFLVEYGRPVLGICFGHQIIGLLNGAECLKGEEARSMQQIDVLKEDEIFSGIEKFIFREDHCEYVTLPENFELLAKSNTCENETMKHKNRIIYGVQFHPEVSGKPGEKLFKNFLKFA